MKIILLECPTRVQKYSSGTAIPSEDTSIKRCISR